MQCGFPDEIQNGFIKNVTRTSYGGIAEYQCNDGLRLTHTDDVDCGPDGTWHNVPTCHCKYIHTYSLRYTTFLCLKL